MDGPQREQEAYPRPREAPDGERASATYLNEQVRPSRRRLGEGEDGADIEEIEKRSSSPKMPVEEAQEAEASSRAQAHVAHVAEAALVRNYIDISY